MPCGNPTNHREAGKNEALLWADHVNDALALVGHAKMADAERRTILGKRINLPCRLVQDLRRRVGRAMPARRGRYVVIGHGQGQSWAADGSLGQTKALEGLRTCDFVNEVAVDVDQATAVRLLVDDM